MENNNNNNNNTAGALKGCIIASLVDTGSVESHRYYIARRTVVEMLSDRGYTSTTIVNVANNEPSDPLAQSLEDFRRVYGQNPDVDTLRLLAHRASNPSRKILVIFGGNFEIGKKNIIGILSQIMNKETLDKVILVLQNKMNSHARKVLDEYPVKVETFQITDLLVNITKHALQPKHEILTAEEKQLLLKKFSIEDKQLPKMLQTDAIAKYYGLEKGQVVKITYGAGLVPDSMVTYRIVV